MNTAQIDKLNRLLIRNLEAEKGLSEVGNHLSDGELRMWLFNLSRIHMRFANELRTKVLMHGEEPKEDTSFRSELHRFWINIKSQVTNSDEEALLKECVRGEKKTLETYEEILEGYTFPEATRHLLSQQKKVILEMLDTVKLEKLVV